jgi:hypothetical protein
MNFPYIFLTYNGITKIVSNELLESITHPQKVQTFQWYRYQLLKMCDNLEIPKKIQGTKGAIYNNITLANKIKQHNDYGSIIKKEDDMKYGLEPCLEHRSIAPIVSNKSQLKKSENKITLKEQEYIIWKCGVLDKPLI